MLEAYEKAQEKIANPDGKKSWEPTLKDILSKTEDSDLFGELLNRNGQEELAAKLVVGELSESDISGLDQYRKMWVESMDRVKTVKESITDDVLNAYTKNNPELQEVVSLIGPEAYKRMIKEKLASLAIKDPDMFDNLASSVEAKNDFEKSEYKELDKEVIDLCKKKGIKSDEYMKAILIEDEDDREKAIKKLVKGGIGFWQNALTFGQKRRNRAELMSMKKDEIDEMISDMKDHQNTVGGFLGGMISNDEIRSAVTAELVGDKINKKETIGFKESKGQLWDDSKLEEAWAVVRADQEYDTLSPTDQEKLKDNFIKARKEQIVKNNENKQGFWGSLFSLFDTKYIDSSKSKLK